eukprot:351323-Chlamydomonas_euryale.AAC.17
MTSAAWARCPAARSFTLCPTRGARRWWTPSRCCGSTSMTTDSGCGGWGSLLCRGQRSGLPMGGGNGLVLQEHDDWKQRLRWPVQSALPW